MPIRPRRIVISNFKIPAYRQAGKCQIKSKSQIPQLKTVALTMVVLAEGVSQRILNFDIHLTFEVWHLTFR